MKFVKKKKVFQNFMILMQGNLAQRDGPTPKGCSRVSSRLGENPLTRLSCQPRLSENSHSRFLKGVLREVSYFKNPSQTFSKPLYVFSFPILFFKFLLLKSKIFFL